MSLRRLAPIPVFCLVFLLYAVWLAYPIALQTADIGRHLMTGEVILRTPGLFWDVTQTNFYTYTNPGYAAVNHHWLSGILLRQMLKLGGWTWLHLGYILVSLVAFGFFIDTGRRLGGVWASLIAAIAFLPLIAERVEIRPEGFAYALTGIVFWILVRTEQGTLPSRWRYAIPAIMVLWVNIHASFPIGFLLLGAFLLSGLFRLSKGEISIDALHSLLFASGLSVAATFLNPNVLGGAIEPFMIFRDPGYAVIENQTLPFLEHLGVFKMSFLFFKVWCVLLIVGSAIAFRSPKSRQLLPYVLIGVLMAVLVWTGARHITMFGFLMIPVLCALVGPIRESSIGWLRHTLVPVAAVVLCSSLLFQFAELRHRWIVIGLAPHSNDAANFIEQNGITGPFFNDFDIAGYLIFHFFPKEKVFVSNVPEAQPPSFFRDVFIPMQEDAAVWQKELQQYQFNAIVVYYHERTQWLQDFIKSRVGDPEWAPVYADDSVLILLRRNGKNADIIQRNEIPASRFDFKK